MVKNADERTQMRQVNNKYFHYKDEYEETQRLLRSYRNELKGGAMEYAEKINFLNNTPEYGRYMVMRPYVKIIDKLQEYIKKLGSYEGDAMSPEQVKSKLEDLQSRQDELKKQMLDELDQPEKSKK